MTQSRFPSSPASVPDGSAGAANPQATASAEPLMPESGNGVESAFARIEALARELEGQPEALLALLRSIEQLHRSIQDGPFRGSLPADRNALFRLLSEMERSGGWPYIPRLQLRTFLDLLGNGSAEEVAQACEPPSPDRGDTPRLVA
jgi:hypothetical protein